VQTVFAPKLCIECDACVDICPMDCITLHDNGEEADLRRASRRRRTNTDQDLYVSDDAATGRVMVKDEDVCLHCGLCAERCPTGAWDMQKFLLTLTARGARVSHAQDASEERSVQKIEASMISSSSSPTSTARARPPRTSCSRRPSCAWACR
jgi:ferredoxin